MSEYDELKRALALDANGAVPVHDEYYRKDARNALAAILALEAQVKELREALEPFSRISAAYPKAKHDANILAVSNPIFDITMGHCHRARAALARLKSPA